MSGVLRPGMALVNRYQIVSLLGQGGMGAVYLANDTHLPGHQVAIKENFDTSQAAQLQFSQEASILASLSHPNLPRVTDHFTDASGRQYLVMNFVAGEDLEQRVERGGPLPEKPALAWIGQVCDALEYLHGQSPPVIHRDIKPGNIKITPDGKAVLVDFGLAKRAVSGQLTAAGARGISPGFSPFEQYGHGTTDPRSDVYALAATLYYLLTAQAPPEAPDLMAAIAALRPPRQVNGQVSKQVDQAIMAGMAVQPADRLPSVAAFRHALSVGTRKAPSRPTKAQSQPKPPPAPPPQKRKSRIGLVTVLLAILAVAGFLALRNTPAVPSATTTTTTRASTAVSTANDEDIWRAVEHSNQLWAQAVRDDNTNGLDQVYSGKWLKETLDKFDTLRRNGRLRRVTLLEFQRLQLVMLDPTHAMATTHEVWKDEVFKRGTNDLDWANTGWAFEQDYFLEKVNNKWVITDGTVREQTAPGAVTTTPRPRPTAPPVPTAPPSAGPQAVVKASGLNLRTGPGYNNEILEVIASGASLAVLGRSDDSKWLNIVTGKGRRGWVDLQYVTLNAPVDGLPVVAP